MKNGLFRTNDSIVRAFFVAKGCSGNLNEMILQHFNTLAGPIKSNSSQESVLVRMDSLGHGKDVKQALNKFFIGKSGGADSVRAEEIFFLNTANTFT